MCYGLERKKRRQESEVHAPAPLFSGSVALGKVLCLSAVCALTRRIEVVPSPPTSQCSLRILVMMLDAAKS